MKRLTIVIIALSINYGKFGALMLSLKLIFISNFHHFLRFPVEEKSMERLLHINSHTTIALIIHIGDR